MVHAAGIDGVGEDAVKQTFREGLPAANLARLGGPSLRDPASTIQILEHGQQRAEIEIQVEDPPDLTSLFRIDDQTAGTGVGCIRSVRSTPRR